MPCPPGWSDTEIQIDFRTRFSTLPFLLFFVYQFNVYVHHFFFCVYSDHLGSRYEFSAFGTLQSSVSWPEEVQEHKSVHSQFCNSRVFSEGSLPSGFNYWQRSKSFGKNVPSFVRRNISIFDLLARFVWSWITQRGRIQEVVARVASRGVVPCYWYFNTL